MENGKPQKYRSILIGSNTSSEKILIKNQFMIEKYCNGKIIMGSLR